MKTNTKQKLKSKSRTGTRVPVRQLERMRAERNKAMECYNILFNDIVKALALHRLGKPDMAHTHISLMLTKTGVPEELISTAVERAQERFRSFEKPAVEVKSVAEDSHPNETP